MFKHILHWVKISIFKIFEKWIKNIAIMLFIDNHLKKINIVEKNFTNKLS